MLSKQLTGYFLELLFAILSNKKKRKKRINVNNRDVYKKTDPSSRMCILCWCRSEWMFCFDMTRQITLQGETLSANSTLVWSLPGAPILHMSI